MLYHQAKRNGLFTVFKPETQPCQRNQICAVQDVTPECVVCDIDGTPVTDDCAPTSEEA